MNQTKMLPVLEMDCHNEDLSFFYLSSCQGDKYTSSVLQVKRDEWLAL